MGDDLHADLDAHRRQFDLNRQTAEPLVRPLTRRQFNWVPEPGRWSVASCLVHLNLSAILFSDAMRQAAERARAAGTLGPGPYRYGFLSRWLYDALEPGNQKRYRAPGKIQPPPSDRDVAPVLDEFLGAGARWDACLEAAEGLDLGRIKVPSPLLPILRFPLGAMFAIQARHEARHLLQAQRVTKTEGFPTS